MNNISKIKRSIKAIAHTGTGYGVYLARVIKTDGQTCSVQIDDITLTDVKLRPVINTSPHKILITPQQGSYVLVIDLSSGKMEHLAVFAYSEIEGIDINLSNNLTINEGTNGGLVKVNELTQKLNAIEKDINNLKQALSSWLPVPNDGGNTLKLITGSWSAAIITPTSKSDIENTKVKH